MRYLPIASAVAAIAAWLVMNWDPWWFRSIQGEPGTMTIYWHDLGIGDQRAPTCPKTPPMRIDGPRFVLSTVMLGIPGAPLSSGMEDHLRARRQSGIEGTKSTALDCHYLFRNILLKEYRLAFKGLAPGRCRFQKSNGQTDAADSCAPWPWNACRITCLPA